MTIPQVPSNLISSAAEAQRRVSELSDQVNEINSTLSAGAQIKKELIESALPEELFTFPAVNLNLPNLSGLVIPQPTVDDIERMVDEKAKQFLNTIQLPIPELPDLTLVQFPKIEIPTLAEIKLYIKTRIKELKRKQVSDILSNQAKAVELAKRPFSTEKDIIAKNQSDQVILPGLPIL